MKPSDTISKKSLRFFCVPAATFFLANNAFAARTFTTSPLARQTEFSGLTCPATFITSALTARKTYTITGLILFWNVFLSLSAHHE